VPDLPDVRYHPAVPAPASPAAQQVIQIISAAEACGQQRLAEMNRQVLGNLDQIIAALETQADTKGTGAADAC
jgi:hypothetical protein